MVFSINTTSYGKSFCFDHCECQPWGQNYFLITNYFCRLYPYPRFILANVVFFVPFGQKKMKLCKTRTPLPRCFRTRHLFVSMVLALHVTPIFDITAVTYKKYIPLPYEIAAIPILSVQFTSACGCGCRHLQCAR